MRSDLHRELPDLFLDEEKIIEEVNRIADGERGGFEVARNILLMHLDTWEESAAGRGWEFDDSHPTVWVLSTIDEYPDWQHEVRVFDRLRMTVWGEQMAGTICDQRDRAEPGFGWFDWLMEYFCSHDWTYPQETS